MEPSMAIRCPKCGGHYLARYFEATHREILDGGKWVPDRIFGQYTLRYRCEVCAHNWQAELSHMEKKQAERIAHVR